MPEVKKSPQAKAKQKTKITSPFKDQALFEKEIRDFANKFKVTVVNQSTRISDYFEMSCFNYIVRFYELKGYSLTVEGLQNGQYRYKCSTSGIQSNFSHFKASINQDEKTHEFEIQHNLAVQSSFDKEIFTMPDITIIRAGKVNTTKDYYDSNKTFSYVNNKDLFSFCEVKNYTPFPELIFNFIGVVNELKKNIIAKRVKHESPCHIAPSLMISGKPNKQTLKIKASLESRYRINIIYDLFYSGSETFSRNRIQSLVIV
jgi:hypothetical protein